MKRLIEKVGELVDLLKIFRRNNSYKITVNDLCKGKPDIPFFVMHKGEEFIVLGDAGKFTFSINKCIDKEQIMSHSQNKDVIINKVDGNYRIIPINLQGLVLIIDGTWSIGKALDTAALARASTRRA